MERSILHCDMNNFYASVERLYDPSLVGVPVAVCGDVEARHGIVLAKSEEAKRFGVKTGDPIWKARDACPELRIVPPHFERYMKYSHLAKEMYLEYTDLVESFGPDECWLDVTASRRLFGDGVEIATVLRERCKKELGLTISVGISFNKVFAKLGSDLKKPDGQTHLPREAVERVVWPLPVDTMLGVGPSTGGALSRFGIRTIGDLSRADDYLLHLRFGKRGAWLKLAARGEDATPVLPADAIIPPKSIGHGLTPPADLETPEQVWTLILALTGEIGARLRESGMQARGIALDLRDRNLMTRSLRRRLPRPTDGTMTLAREAFSLFRERYLFHEPLRSLSVRAIDLERDETPQLSLFQEKSDLREMRIDRLCDRLAARYGKPILLPARILSTPLPEKADYKPFH